MSDTAAREFYAAEARRLSSRVRLFAIQSAVGAVLMVLSVVIAGGRSGPGGASNPAAFYVGAPGIALLIVGLVGVRSFSVRRADLRAKESALADGPSAPG